MAADGDGARNAGMGLGMDLFTPDSFVHTASAFMQRSRSCGYAIGFAFNRDQAYRRVRRTCRFHCLVPVVAPPGRGYVNVQGV